MRKSTPLKLGLNVRKPKAPTSDALAENAQRQRPSVFSDDNDDVLEEKEPATAQPHFTGGSQSRESAKLAKDLEETDPSVYAYDDVYDSINAARSRINAARRKNDDNKPKYMEKLMETAKRRQVQQEVVKERVLEKERQREGEMHADKETFVTSAYKELKDQRQQLVKEEEKQEEEDGRKSAAGSKSKQLFGASAGFYREFLDQVDRED
ncbi:Nuclear speckle splicing regulatory protein 1, partial [Coemansia sp. RSA 2399]